jgi:hypothetical protein
LRSGLVIFRALRGQVNSNTVIVGCVVAPKLSKKKKKFLGHSGLADETVKN